MILRNLLCARRTMHHIRYTIEIWPLFTGDWSHINAYGLPGMPQPELEKILKKKKQAGSRKVVKTIGKSNTIGSQCLILLDFPKVFTTFLDLAFFFFFRIFSSSGRSQADSQPLVEDWLELATLPADWSTPAVLHQ